MKKIYHLYITLFLAGILLFCSCADFVELEEPDHIITTNTVFADDVTAQRAMTGIYNELFNTSFSNGGNRSVTFLAGLSADNFTPSTNTLQILEFSQNAISPANSWNLDLWASAYHMIYMTNALLEGIARSSGISQAAQERLEGEARFVRAFTYWNLVNLYGEVPLIIQTGYNQNSTAPRQAEGAVLAQVIEDLEAALDLLGDSYVEEDRTGPNRFAAMGLLARIYLYQEDWAQASYYSEQVISQASLYELLANPNEVFLANSREALWQISPLGWGNGFTHTREGNLFIYNPTTSTPVRLSEDFMASWESPEDLRYQHWVNSHTEDGEQIYYPYKYKVQYDASGGQTTEYSMVLRLAEQYLIKAEAEARTGNLSAAVAAIDAIRQRAGLPLVADVQPAIANGEILALVLEERRKEFFGEWGHRWLDLKRLGESDELEDKDQVEWQTTDWLYPIPEEERFKNPNLTQNNGY